MRLPLDKLKGLLLAAVLILISIMPSYAGSDVAGMWKKANALYQQKQYDSAQALFLQVAKARPGVAEVYYNIANTYYRLNKIAPAVVYYQKALHLKPGYKEAQDNLAITENRIPNHIAQAPEIFFVRWWHSLTAAGLADLWAVVALITFIVMVLIVLANAMRKGRKTLPVQVPVILGVVWLVMLLLGWVAGNNAAHSGIAVVMQNDTPLMGAGLKGKSQVYLPEGTAVKVSSVNGDVAEVTLPDGRKGAVDAALIKSIDNL